MASFTPVETASAIRPDTVTGSHIFMVFGYSLTKGIGIREYISSEVFTISGYDWVIKYYPDGEHNEAKSFLSFYLYLKSKNTNVKAWFTFTILQRNGVPSNMSMTSEVMTFRTTRGSSHYSCWGYSQFAEKKYFEASECLKDDAFILKCIVTVVKGTKLEPVIPYGVPVPWPDLYQNLANLLDSGKGADVTFVVKGERFNAHRCVLAARSAVFSAELFGCMKENWTDTITIDDIEALVSKSMLYFIYSDMLLNFEGDQDPRLMAQHLLVAADRYGLERLRLICEDILCKNLTVNTAATTLILAEQHNCSQLKAECLRFMSSPEVFKAVAQTDEFHNLVKICPAVLKNI